MAERAPRAYSYLILAFGLIRPCSTFVDTDEKRIRHTRQTLDAASLITVLLNKALPWQYLGGVSSERPLWKVLTSGLCSVCAQLQAELGLNALAAMRRNAKPV
jgi:hypothetical protein